MNNIKRSILYNIRKGFEEVQNNFLLNLLHKDEMNPISALKQIIDIKLSTSILDNFQTLDSSINVDKKNALVINFFSSYFNK